METQEHKAQHSAPRPSPFDAPQCACEHTGSSSSCNCQQSAAPQKQPPLNRVRFFSMAAAALCCWGLAYAAVEPLSTWLTFTLAGLEQASPLGSAVQFFLYDTAKILLLLVLMVYVIGWLRAGMKLERVRDYLAGKGRGVGYVLGAGFGAVTPFCSCSSIPLFLGFTTARIPLGITMAFLITSPLVNEIAVVLLWGLLGWKFTVIYVAVGLGAGILGGIIMDMLHAERWLQPFVLESMNKRPLLSLQARRALPPDLQERHDFAAAETCTIFRRVWRWVLAGVALGALLHGFVPQAWFAAHLSAGQWWSVPLAVGVGIPLYTNVTGIVPIMESLLLKGLPLGTTLAFCMSTVAASLPEMLMLKQVMRWQLLAMFLGMLLVIFTLVGWLFNLLPAVLL